jgi:hypothetical protein
VTAAIAAVSLAAMASPASAVTLFPDLKTGQIKQGDLMISKPQTKHAKLEISNEVVNVGRGPVEIATGETSNNCDGDNVPDNDVDGTQMLYEDDGDGVFVRDDDTTAVPSGNPSLCVKQQGDYYWQIWNLARYTLTSIRTGEIARERDKIAYCTVDSTPLFPELDGYVPEAYYPLAGPNGLCQPGGTLGISIGWADIYSFGLPGQQLSLEGLTGGRYCLTSEANPAEVLEEGSAAPDPYANNSRSVLVRLHLHAGTVEKLAQGCDV